MIFGYKEINHNIYYFHEHVAYMFRRMFELDLAQYNEDLLVHPDFVSILNSANKTILEPFKEIVELYHVLPKGDKIQLQVAFNYNNSTLTLEDKSVHPIKFAELNPLIGEKLKAFCVDLWDDYPQVNQMKADFGTVKDHYDKLVAEDNCDGIICPFCGIETFEPSGEKYREAYDHLLAKADYPFVSINFKLLFPACHKCNSNEKRSTDTLINEDGSRRVVYNPYDSSLTCNDLEILIVPNEDYEESKLETLLRSIDWRFELRRNNIPDDRLESWDAIYHIRRRFRKRIGRLEKEWFFEIKKKYKDSLEDKIAFNRFREQFMSSAKYQIPISGMGIIRYSYFNFLFSIPHFEEKLQASVS